MRYKDFMEKIDHILIVDDDQDIRELLQQYLKKNGLKVSTAANGRQMRTVLAAEDIDMIVLDLMMPGEDGLVLCRELNANTQNLVPILMLTAKSDEADRILGLEMGADDYLTKPFASRELLARIRSVLRRTRMVPASMRVEDTAQTDNYLRHFGTWTLDTRARNLLDASGALVFLSGAEYRLLQVFLDHANRVLTRDQLLGLTQGRDADIFDRSIDILVSRLRKRLRDDSREPVFIKTVRSEGYLFSGTTNRSEAVR